MAGNDQYHGGKGIDTVDYSLSIDGIIVNLLKTTVQYVSGGSGSDTLISIENLAGSQFDDRLTGNQRANNLTGLNGDDLLSGNGGTDVIDAGTGNDTVYGGSGNDRFIGDMAGDDRYFGGAGIDTLDYSASTEGIAVSLITTVPQLISTGSGVDVLNSIESLVGSQFNDNISGNLLDNRLRGLGGADSLSGRHGDDVIDGGDGDDTLTGGNGDDALLGGAGNDSVLGGIGNDRFIGDMAGDDRYFGGAGVDTLDYSESIDPITVNLVTTVAQHISTGSGTDTLNSIEYLLGSPFSDILIGNAAANRLNGGHGNDSLSGGAGADRFVFDTAINIDNIDTLTDFSVGKDLIVLSASIFTAYAGQVGQVVGLSINFSYDPESGALSYDVDGAGEGAAAEIAIIGLNEHPAILGNDFLIIA